MLIIVFSDLIDFKCVSVSKLLLQDLNLVVLEKPLINYLFRIENKFLKKN